MENMELSKKIREARSNGNAVLYSSLIDENGFPMENDLLYERGRIERGLISESNEKGYISESYLYTPERAEAWISFFDIIIDYESKR